MKKISHAACLALTAVLASGAFAITYGDDSSASMAAGGLQLRREARISMEKERLEIGVDKVTVDFDFLNESNSDITTDVAFQFPPYGRGANEDSITNIYNFHVWVGGTEKRYQTDIHAIINGKDVTAALLKFGLDIVELDSDPDDQKEFNILASLPDAQRNQMIAIGFVDKDFLPLWHIEKLSYWKQTFPAHKVVHIRHEYEPANGFLMIQAGDLDPQRPHRPEKELERVSDLYKQIEDACVDPALANSLGAKSSPSTPIEMSWVDYVLTTANSWKTPIKDFTLVIDRTKRADLAGSFISLCWDGPIKKLDADHFEARQLNFVSREELHVVFLSRFAANNN